MARIKASKPDDRSERQRTARLVASIGILGSKQGVGRSEPRECATMDPRSGAEAGAFIGLSWSGIRAIRDIRGQRLVD